MSSLITLHVKVVRLGLLLTWSSPIQVGYLANELQGVGCLHKPPISTSLLGLRAWAAWLFSWLLGILRVACWFRGEVWC